MFEAAAKPGGFLRHAIPQYRLPARRRRRRTSPTSPRSASTSSPGHAVRDLEALKAEGYDAVLVATGTPRPMELGVPGEDAEGVHTGLTFLRRVSEDELPDMTGRTVAVVGGGNVAMDAARTARRLGSREVRVAYRRGREEMPAHRVEVDEAEMEGVVLRLPRRARRGRQGRGGCRRPACAASACGSARPTPPGAGAPSPSPGASSCSSARSSSPPWAWSRTTTPYEHVTGDARGHRIKVDPITLQSDHPYLFAAGDVESGASDITRAIGHGRRAAYMIDRWIHGQTAGRLPAVRRPAGRRAARRRARPPERLHPPRARTRGHRALQQPDGLRRARARDDRGGGSRGRRAPASTAASARSARSASRPALPTRSGST